MKKTKIKFIILLFVIFLLYTATSYASTLGDTLSGGKDFLAASSGNVVADDTALKDVSGGVYNALLMVSFVVAAIIGISLGIKFMTAGVEDKANVKKSLIIFVIGCFVAYGAFAIWKVIVDAISTTGIT